jgi:hypothetical protein
VPNFQSASKLQLKYTAEEITQILLHLKGANPKAYEAMLPNFLTSDHSELGVRLLQSNAKVAKALCHMHEATAVMAELVISQPPGAILSNVADFLCSKKSCASVIDPLIADMQHEYFEALSKGRTNKARWIRIRETIRLFYVLGVYRALKTITGLFSHPKLPQ